MSAPNTGAGRTAGPWHVERGTGIYNANGALVAQCDTRVAHQIPEDIANAEFIIHAVNTLPALVEALERLVVANEENRDGDLCGLCLSLHGREHEGAGRYAPDCALVIARAALSSARKVAKP